MADSVGTSGATVTNGSVPAGAAATSGTTVQPDGGPTSPEFAALLAAAGFGLVMVFLALLPWLVRSNLPDFSKVGPTVVSALLGAVVNPRRAVRGSAWEVIGTLALLAIASTGGVLLLHPDRPIALPAFSAAIAAFAGLLVDTSGYTHPSAR